MNETFEPLTAKSSRHAHLVGCRGAGMRALGDVLLGLGWRVSGSDINGDGEGSAGRSDATVFRGHDARHVADCVELVVRSDAVPDDNPELAQARRRELPILSYFQAVGQLARNKRTLAVAGSHGKSTTTLMLGHILTEARCDPTILCGASLLNKAGGNIHSGGRTGRGPSLVVEACEYRRNFLHVSPHATILHNVEHDHFDCYATIDSLESAFGEFAARTAPTGRLLVDHDSPIARRAADRAACGVETFGLSPLADWSARLMDSHYGRYRVEIAHRGRSLGELRLPLPGLHNALNALAAAAMAAGEGVDAPSIIAALTTLPGITRRLEDRGTSGGIRLLDDYAHHPTEVTAALKTVRQMADGETVLAVFQPHQRLRTERLIDEFAASLQHADVTVLTDVYSARESTDAAGLSQASVLSDRLARRARDGGAQVVRVADPTEAAHFLRTHLRPPALVVTLGAGNVRAAGDLMRIDTGVAAPMPRFDLANPAFDRR